MSNRASNFFAAVEALTSGVSRKTYQYGRHIAFLAAAKEMRERAAGYGHGGGSEGQAALDGAARWLEAQAEDSRKALMAEND